MKRIIFCIGTLFFLIEQDLNAQCNENQNFSNYNEQIIVRDGGDTFCDDCAPPWMPSHGTPQIFSEAPWPNTNKIAYMWSDKYDEGTRGEGILAAYPFKRNYKYNVSIRYNAKLTSADNSNGSHFALLAAQNIHRPTTWKKGNHLPSSDRHQVIATNPDKTGIWKISDYTFIADDDYDQFWIYAYATEWNQYNLYVDWIVICRDECTGSIYYNQGVLPTTEPRSGYIYVGSSYGGSGTVTVSSTANTTITAGNEINIGPGFNALVSTGSFLARIDPCPGTVLSRRPASDTANDIDISQFPIEEDTATGGFENEYESEFGRRGVVQQAKTTPDEVIKKRDLLIYPNPAFNKLNIQFYSEKEGKIRVRILNSVGILYREVNSFSAAKSLKRIDLDITNLPNGTYLIQVVDATGNVSVKKIQKLK
ncbi:MAG: T9SS type A sorting domain-containing protein [Chitinophagaceae bacterium]